METLFEMPGANVQRSTSNFQLPSKKAGNRQATSPNPAAKRKRAKKLRGELGPYETACHYFDRGNRPIEITRITAMGITYRLRGTTDEYVLPHGTGFQKALSIKAGVDTGPRTGAIKRGGVS